MGVVYHAQHRKTGNRVAMKTIRLPRAQLLAGIRREIRLLSSLKHSGIIRIYEEGEYDGLPWYTMELFDGVTLRHFIRHVGATGKSTLRNQAVNETKTDTTRYRERTQVISDRHSGSSGDGAVTAESGNGESSSDFALEMKKRLAAFTRLVDSHQTPIPLATIFTIVSQLCSPLSYLHGEGIIHRDLKPENILIRENGLPVLVDFGIVSRFSGHISRETLEIDYSYAGTPSYIAPEQIMGETIDARTDLYALGCIFYELLVGHPPFYGTRITDILRAHVHAVPVPPSQFRKDIPREIDTLVLSLLAKEPRHRPGFADRLASQLISMGAAESAYTEEEKPLPYLYRAGFTDRLEPIVYLENRLKKVLDGKGGVYFIRGEGGVGKTRLLVEIGKKAVNNSISLYTGECPDKNSPALQALRKLSQSIADYCRETGKSETDRIVGNRGPLFSLYWPRFKDLPGQSHFPEPIQLPPREAAVRLNTYLWQTIVAMNKDKIMLLIIDDIHWADDVTITFLDFILEGKKTSHHPILIIGSVLASEVSPEFQKLLDKADGIIDLPCLEEKDVTMKPEPFVSPQKSMLLSIQIYERQPGN